MTVRVRIAPSPTGDPHVGTAYIALFNYVFAKQQGGQFILRIEDTDQARSHPASEAAILRALRWVGLDWDEGPDLGGPYGPYRQSERTALYREAADALLAAGQAYRCFCTPERLDAVRKQKQAQKESFVGYDGHCRRLTPAESRARAAAQEPHVIRLRTPGAGETVVVDELRGEVRFDNRQIDDQVLLKSDGFPTYHLANVVDDHAMAITHVIRAEEWLSSTPKHVLLYAAFGWQAPKWIHMPLLRNADRSKISKRKNPVSLDFYRDAGFLPEALLNYLGTMGWSIAGDRELFTLAEMIAAFSWDRVRLGGPVFDLVKLQAMNAHYLRSLDDAGIVARLRSWRFSDEYLARLVPLVRERIELLSDFVGKTEIFFAADVDFTPVAAAFSLKGRSRVEVIDVLEQMGEALDGLREWTAPTLDTTLRTLATKLGWKPKELFPLLRLAATARNATPPLFDTIAALGRDLTRRRLRQCVAFVKALPEPATPTPASS